jgi:hypothetical protein
MESERRLSHSDWALYDTAHAVLQPKHMSPGELQESYAWIYQRLFSHASIWRRRPADWRAVASCVAMSYLFRQSLIQRRLVHAVWRPLVEMTRLRRLAFRRRLAARETLDGPQHLELLKHFPDRNDFNRLCL